MPPTSAGILLFRRVAGATDVLLAHPGGPYWRARDVGAWSIPKGEVHDGEALLDAARREFEEETGSAVTGREIALGHVRQRAGKVVHAWAVEGALDPATLRSAAFEMEWPRGSGRLRQFPEVDRVAWFSLEEARRRLLPSLVPLLDALSAHLDEDAASQPTGV
ncbi:MAG: NUDIX domain-containing protein [Acidobacteria bacterium]|nr:NUDIX domain-containing protein [Acidobacteriota bacterium]